jgi:hypothetical protein
VGGGAAAPAVVAMRRIAVVAGAAVGAVVAILLVAHSVSTPAGAPTVPLAVHATFAPPLVQFGDPTTVRIDVELDRGAVQSKTLHVRTDLTPLTALSPARTSRTISGRLETVSIVQRVACVSDPCLAKTVTLHPIRTSVTTRSGAVSRTSSSLLLQLGSRVTAADLSRATPHFAADTAPPAPSYRIAPSTAAPVLDVIAALAAGGAAVLVALQVLAVRRRRATEGAADDLARALRLVREAETRPVPDRRRALALLARVLRNRDVRLGPAVSDLAWSEPPPDPQAIDALVSDVEGERAG